MSEIFLTPRKTWEKQNGLFLASRGVRELRWRQLGHPRLGLGKGRVQLRLLDLLGKGRVQLRLLDLLWELTSFGFYSAPAFCNGLDVFIFTDVPYLGDLLVTIARLLGKVLFFPDTGDAFCKLSKVMIEGYAGGFF